MDDLNGQILAGVALIFGAVALTSHPVYTGIKSAVVKAGGSIGLGIGVGMGLIALSLVGGIVLLRNA